MSPKKKDTPVGSRAIDRSDIEAKLREIKGEVDATATASRPTAVAIAGVAAVAVIAAVYLLGRRAGKKRTTVVEIRRV